MSYNELLRPKEILTKAYEQVSDIGSSTACVCTINNNIMECCNLGDYGFILYRKQPNNTYS